MSDDLVDSAALPLAVLRRQVAALLSQIDTATLPAPDRVRNNRQDTPGCEWRPGKGWVLFTVENGEHAGVVFLDHACDDIRYGWSEPGDWEALRVEDARAIGLAFLAAANRAEEIFTAIPRIPAKRGVRKGPAT